MKWKTGRKREKVQQQTFTNLPQHMLTHTCQWRGGNAFHPITKLLYARPG